MVGLLLLCVEIPRSVHRLALMGPSAVSVELMPDCLEVSLSPKVLMFPSFQVSPSSSYLPTGLPEPG